MGMADETFLVTGSSGCIGSWVLRQLVSEGAQVVAAHSRRDYHRPRLLMNSNELERIHFVRFDIRDLDSLKAIIGEHDVTHVIHLAALQVPFCKADPCLGAEINVVGTVNVFEAIRHAGDQVRGYVYASSIAVFGPKEYYPEKPVSDDAPLRPDTLYGVYKQANEHTARVYWQDWKISSVGLRPCILYGVGRDQGLTSDLSKAVLAAAAERPFHIKFSGEAGIQYNEDVAKMFIEAARSSQKGALVCNMRNDVVDVSDFVSSLKREVPEAQITYETDNPLPFPFDVEIPNLKQLLGSVPHTPMNTAIQQSLDQYKELLAENRLDLGQLDR
jgi:nucleoside-diphosphate-sugar epimerase